MKVAEIKAEILHLFSPKNKYVRRFVSIFSLLSFLKEIN
jgi:hypothetical protein